MKALRKLSILLVSGMMIAGCFHANPKSANQPSSNPNISETSSGDIVTSSSETPSSSSPSVSKYSHGPEDTLVETIALRNDHYSTTVGKTITIVATVMPKTATNKTLVWSSSDEDLATVNKDGKVTALAPGEVTITAMSTDGTDITDSATVTISAIELEGITVANKNMETSLGSTFYITYALQPSNTSYKKVTYDIDDESILSVNENGQFTAIGVGKTDVVLMTANPEIFAIVSVKVNDIILYGFEFRQNYVEMHVGEVHSLDPYYYPKSGAVIPTNYTSDNEAVAKVNSDGLVEAVGRGTCTITGATARGGHSDTIEVKVLNDQVLRRTTLKSGFREKFDNSAYQYANSATIGNVKWLVIPVWFTDSDNYVAVSKKEDVRNDITNAFFGTSASVGWRSVSTFYEEESFNKLHLSGTVTEWYHLNQSVSQYKTSGDSGAVCRNILSWYKGNHPEDSLSNYDYNKDGVLDAVIMIYVAPTDGNKLWAYCALGSTVRAQPDREPNLGTHMWASYSFMYGNNISQKTGKTGTRGAGNTSNCNIDTHTFIHESGHLLGADDYYDYSGNYCPAGGYTMQDYDWGMHDPFSVMAYGWTDPYIPTESCTVTINAFNATGDVVILTPRWNNYDSPFDEYIAIEYFTPKGLNQFDSTTGHREIYVNKSGIRIWHVDARLAYSTGYSFTYSNITTNPNIANQRVEYAFNNTSSGDSGRLSVLGSSYSDFNILTLVRNYDNVTYKNPYPASQNDFYFEGDTFKIDGRREKNQFPNQGRLDSGEQLGWMVNFLEQDSGSATLEIIKL